jgi:hypothetical protein
MDENFSRVIFIYGMAIVLGLGKAFTLLIWRTLPRSQPGLRQELREAWQDLIRRRSPSQAAGDPARRGTPQVAIPATAAQHDQRP